MIVFELICGTEHRFEGWFGSSEDFENQQGRGLLCCPTCGTATVRKLLTAKIGHTERGSSAIPQVHRNSQPSDLKEFSSVIDHILLNTEDVGPQFVTEARRMNFGEIPFRAIRGEASSSDAEALRDEGIQVFSLPIPSKDGWN